MTSTVYYSDNPEDALSILLSECDKVLPTIQDTVLHDDFLYAITNAEMWDSSIEEKGTAQDTIDKLTNILNDALDYIASESPKEYSLDERKELIKKIKAVLREV